MGKKISIIMPVYNTAEYLDKAILSVLNQTYENLELILVDDGSTDGSEKIVAKYANQDNRIVLCHQNNHGESHARNIGLSMATGAYWTFMDCDDWLEFDMYETLIGSMERNDVDVTCGSWFEEIQESTIVVGCEEPIGNETFDWQQMMYYLYRRDQYRAFGFMWNKIYKKEIFFDECGNMLLFDEKLILGGDIIYLAQLLTNANKFNFVNRPFYHYRRHQKSGSYSKNINNRLGTIDAYERVIKLLEKRGAWEDTINYAKRFLAYHCCLTMKVAIEQKDFEKIVLLQTYMKKYEENYRRMNDGFPERIEEYHRLMEYSVL